MADRAAIEGDWLVALHQDSGRGRQGRTWVSVEGNFYGSTIVQLRTDDPPAPTLSLAAGLALIEAIDVAVSANGLMLKWPNDVIRGGKKVAGILLERSGDRVAVGFGVNLVGAPELADRRAGSLGATILPQAFAPLLAASFARILSVWRQSEPGLLAKAWLERAHPVGAVLKVHSSTEEEVIGRFEGIDRDGALRLRRSDGSVEVIRAGDVEL